MSQWQVNSQRAPNAGRESCQTPVLQLSQCRLAINKGESVTLGQTPLRGGVAIDRKLLRRQDETPMNRLINGAGLAKLLQFFYKSLTTPVGGQTNLIT